MTMINRDPFAREELHRDAVATADTCRWCGGTRRGGKLFAYATETDGGRRYEHRGLFCGKSCHDAYHGVR